MATYDPGFGVGKSFENYGDTTFRTGYGIEGGLDPEYVKRMAAARPDLFAGIDVSKLDSMFTPNMVEGESQQTQQGWNIDPALAELFSDWNMQRRGAAGLEDGRTNAIYDKDGNLLYADEPYSYQPAKDNLKTLLEGGALAAAAFGGLGLAGAGPWSGLAGEGGLGSLAAENAAMDAAMIDMGAGATNVGAAGSAAGAGAGGIGSLGMEAQLAADLASLGGGAAGGTGSVNAALMESMAGGGGYGASSAGVGGVTAGQTAVNAALNPYLNTLGKLSPELASMAGAATGGIGSVVGPVADALVPASVLDKMGGGDGSTGGIGGKGGGGGGGDYDWMKLLLAALAGGAAYNDAKKPQLTGYTGGIKPRTVTQTVEQGKYGPISKTKFAAGGGVAPTGIADAGVPRYLGSAHDGMEDTIPAHIDGKEPAALSGGEFVVPADVVSHIGNGNSNAGAQQLFKMMDRVRAARTGTTEQGKQIDPQRFMPV